MVLSRIYIDKNLDYFDLDNIVYWYSVCFDIFVFKILLCALFFFISAFSIENHLSNLKIECARFLCIFAGVGIFQYLFLASLYYLKLSNLYTSYFGLSNTLGTISVIVFGILLPYTKKEQHDE